VTLHDWIRGHEFLLPLARERARIDAAIAAAAPPCPAPPDWNDYRADFEAGVPLLHSADVVVDVHAAGGSIVDAVSRLARHEVDSALTNELRELNEFLQNGEDAPGRVVDWLLGFDAWTPPGSGLLRCVGWLTLTVSLAPLVDLFAGWRDEERWMRRHCPTCGSLPTIAQLVGVDPGRQRYLCCGCCGTKWRFGRTRCPFCDAETHRRASVLVENEAGLRIDYCESCSGYLKTYDGQGGEAVMLADWTTLHLDLAASDRGWKRMAASLYDFDISQTPESRGNSGVSEAGGHRPHAIHP
jgi:FdhE protein